MAKEKFKAQLGLDNSEFKGKLKEAEGAVGKFGNYLKKIGGLMAAAFSINAIVNFTKEAIKLAATLEGVEAGFKRIAYPGLLDELRKATRGTVTDLQLMQNAIQAKNFDIPLEQMATLLKFAGDRALQTGQNVDYLVDSIIIGIGRKSPLILDNLGISAIRLREELKGVGVEMTTVSDVAAAVGKIATEEMQKMGEVTDTTATKMASVSASWTNLKTSFGKFITSLGFFIKMLDNISTRLETFGDPDLSFMEKITWSPNEYKEWKKQKADIEKFFGIKTDKKAFVGATTFPSFGAKKTEPIIPPVSDETLKSIADYIKEIKKANVEAEKQAKAWEIIRGEIAKAKGGIIKSIPTDKLSLGKGMPGMEGIQHREIKLPEVNLQQSEWANAWKDAIRGVTDFMADAFGEVFERIGEGSMKGLGSELLGSFGQLISDFGKMLVSLGTMWLLALTLMKIPTIPTALAAIAIGAGAIALGGLMKGASKRMAENMESGGGGGYSPQANQMSSINVQGIIKGKDIYLSNQRYSGELNTGT